MCATIALVGWGWHPGPGREPAPGSAEQTYRAIEDWTAAGAPCPSRLMQACNFFDYFAVILLL